MPYARGYPRRFLVNIFFFFNDTATTEIYTLSLHDALPILPAPPMRFASWTNPSLAALWVSRMRSPRSEEHTSELQSQSNLVCRLLLEKKKTTRRTKRGSTPQCSKTRTVPTSLNYCATLTIA